MAVTTLGKDGAAIKIPPIKISIAVCFGYCLKLYRKHEIYVNSYTQCQYFCSPSGSVQAEVSAAKPQSFTRAHALTYTVYSVLAFKFS